VALWSVPARAIGVGIELGGVSAQTSGVNQDSESIGTPSAGLIVENDFPIGRVSLDLWADVQSPISLRSGFSAGDLLGEATPWYIPIDLGLRLSLPVAGVKPYVGVLGQAAVLIDSRRLSDPVALTNPLWGLGADLGLCVPVSDLVRLDFEFRYVDV
jgi:hypothetical protein